MSSASLQPSGIGPVDAAWGGLARPGAYLLVGSAGQGRLDLSSRIVGGAAASPSLTLLFSAREPGAILAVARQAGVDLAAAGDRVQLKGVPLGAQLSALGEEGLVRMLEGLAEAADGAGLVVVEDFTPFVRFRSFDAFGAAFKRLVAAIEGHGSTLVLGLGEPANDGSRKLLDFIEGVVTGTVRLADAGRMLQLIPGTGHEGEPQDKPWSRTAEEPAAPAPPADVQAEPAPVPEIEPAAEAPAPPDHAAEIEAVQPDEHYEHSSDGYGGSDPAELDAGALVVSNVPSEPFGHTPSPTPLPSPFGAPAPGSGGDGQGWAAIQTVESPPRDFGDSYADVLTSGVLIDSNDPATAVPLAAPPQPSLPAAPAIIPVHAVPPAPSRVADPLMTEPDFGSADPEAGFTDDLDGAFAAGAPFLVVALRIAEGSSYFTDFPTVADGLLGALSGSDRALVRDDQARLVVLLPGAPADAPEQLLAAVRAHLDSILGARAGAAFASVGVLVLPDGAPFTDAAGLLEYALG